LNSPNNAIRRLLLVKTSSLGDVVHNLPAVSDLSVRFPRAEIDWLVEEAFAPIPRLHAMVHRVIPVNLRRWRGNILSRETWREIRALRGALASAPYDAVIDTQGLLKSALLARLARGPRIGPDWKSSREPLAIFYDRVVAAPWALHAVERNRVLAAGALGYEVSGPANYAIQVPPASMQRLRTALSGALRTALDRPFALLLHATSDPAKQWPGERWATLGAALHARGLQSWLPFGSEAERLRSEWLADRIPGALVPPRFALDLAAALLCAASVVVGVDTGLAHLAAALGRPTVGIFCATDPAATGLYGAARAVNLGNLHRRPAVAEVAAAVERLIG